MSRMRVRRAVAGLGVLLTAALCLMFVHTRGSAIATEEVSITVTFLNNTGQTANDLDVCFSDEVCGLGWTGQGVNLPFHTPLPAIIVTHRGADVPDQSGTQYRYVALLPAGQNLDVAGAFWTLDGVIIGLADWHL